MCINSSLHIQNRQNAKILTSFEMKHKNMSLLLIEEISSSVTGALQSRIINISNEPDTNLIYLYQYILIETDVLPLLCEYSDFCCGKFFQKHSIIILYKLVIQNL